MRLVCSVSSMNVDVASQGVVGVGKKIRSTVSVFKKGEDSFLMWCTTKNKQGTKYKLRDNVEKCFNKMVAEGKATLRLKEPHVDIQMCNANVIDLKRLLNGIKMASIGESLIGKGVLSSSGPVQNKVLKKPQTKMKITCKKSYPLVNGFPSTLEHLTTENCELVKVDSRILKLRHLTHLSLDNNKISALPDAISQMQHLVELSVQENLLVELPKTFCNPSSKLCSTLRSLKLNDNLIQFLPHDIGNLSELYQIHLHRNQLKYLPHDIWRLTNLKMFFASDNQIRVIPFSIKKLSLDKIDLSQNDFMNVGSPSVINKLAKFRTLQEITANYILKNEVPRKTRDLTHVCHDFLEEGRKCLFCTNFVFRSYVRMALCLDLYRVSQMVVHMTSRWRKSAPIDVFVCSVECFQRFRFNRIKLDLPDEGAQPSI